MTVYGYYKCSNNYLHEMFRIKTEHMLRITSYCTYWMESYARKDPFRVSFNACEEDKDISSYRTMKDYFIQSNSKYMPGF